MPTPPLSEERRSRFHLALRAVDGVGLEGASVLGDGYVSQAWLLADGETVARIPKYAWAEMDLAYEVNLLPVVERAELPIAVPRGARSIRDSAGFVGGLHTLVRGDALADRIEALAGTPAAEALARDLGRFLSALHAIPAGNLPRGGANPYPKDFEKWTRTLSRYVEPDVAGWLEGLRASLAALAPPAGASAVLTHGDLWSHHLMVDADGRLSGVIDFGLASVFDPAWDLRSLVGPESLLRGELGLEAEATFLANYDVPLDPHALARAEVYDALDTVGDAYHELTYLATDDALRLVRERAARELASR